MHKSLDSMKRKFMKLDRYSNQLEINFNGETHIPTTPGLLVSLIVYVVLIAFATVRFNQLINQ